MSGASRISVLGLACATLIAGTVATSAQGVTMNIGWSTPLDSDYGVLATKFKELVEDYSDGTIEVKLRCCGQIASEDDAYKAMQLGTVDAYFVSQNNVSPHWPLMDVFVLPYIFEDTEHLVTVAEGPVGEQIRAQIAEDTGVHLLTFGGPSYRDFFNSKQPINEMADMAGLKIRVPRNNVMLATFEAFGAEPVPLAWSETPTALQTGTIDGGDNGTNVIQEMKFYEFAPYLTVLDHFAGFSPLFASDRFMSQLDEAQTDAVQRAAAEAGAFHTEYMIGKIESVREWLTTEGGMVITRPERAEFIAAAETVQEQVADERGETFRDLLDRIRAAAR